MEPITSLAYIISSFYGYYIGSDLYNYFVYRRDYNELKRTLDSIEVSINRLDSKFN
jgi:hypothetical protein